MRDRGRVGRDGELLEIRAVGCAGTEPHPPKRVGDVRARFVQPARAEPPSVALVGREVADVRADPLGWGGGVLGGERRGDQQETDRMHTVISMVGAALTVVAPVGADRGAGPDRPHIPDRVATEPAGRGRGFERRRRAQLQEWQSVAPPHTAPTLMDSMANAQTFAGHFARAVDLFRDPATKKAQKQEFRALVEIVKESAITVVVREAKLFVNDETVSGPEVEPLLARLALHGVQEIVLPRDTPVSHLFELVQALAEDPAGREDVRTRLRESGAHRLSIVALGGAEMPLPEGSDLLGTGGLLRGDPMAEFHSVPVPGAGGVTHEPTTDADNALPGAGHAQVGASAYDPLAPEPAVGEEPAPPAEPAAPPGAAPFAPPTEASSPSPSPPPAEAASSPPLPPGAAR